MKKLVTLATLAVVATSALSETTITLDGWPDMDKESALYVDNVKTTDTDACASSAYSITSSALAAGATYSITVTETDGGGNESSQSAALSVEIDAQAPTISETTAVGATTSNNTSDTTPDVVINSDEAGTIAFGGGCGTAANTIASGDNTITLTAADNSRINPCCKRIWVL